MPILILKDIAVDQDKLRHALVTPQNARNVFSELGNSSFYMPSVELFDKLEYSLLSLHYDGCDIFALHTNGDFEIAPGFSEDLYEIKD